MKFHTTHNNVVISIEYDETAAAFDGVVFECEVTYNGQDVTELLLNSYEGFLMECEQNLAAIAYAEHQNHAYDKGQDRYEDARA